MGEQPRKAPLEAIEAETRAKYSGTFYDPKTILLNQQGRPRDFFSRLLALKMSLVRHYANPRVPLLDLCCATGGYLMEVADQGSLAVGLDFSLPFLHEATAQEGAAFLCGNARELPFASKTFGLVYSYASLYHIPRVEEVMSEVYRVLAPGGVALLEMGNCRSLNHLVSMAHEETARPFHYPPGQMRSMLREAGFAVERAFAFQLLPYWGSKPGWLRPLLHPLWKKGLEKTWRGRMLDEWLCRLPGLSAFAFRWIFVCRKEAP